MVCNSFNVPVWLVAGIDCSSSETYLPLHRLLLEHAPHDEASFDESDRLRIVSPPLPDVRPPCCEHVLLTRTCLQSLPDQRHVYTMRCSCLGNSCDHCQGAPLSRVSFTQAAHLHQIIPLLRRQALYNAVVRTCSRQSSATGLTNRPRDSRSRRSPHSF